MERIISDFFFAWRDLPHCFERVRDEFGLDGVELSFHPTYAHPHCTREDIDTARRINEDFGLVLTAHIWEDLPQLGPREGGDALRVWLDACDRTGVAKLVVHGGTFDDRTAGLERMRETLEGVLGDFEKHGVVLHLENHYPYAYHHCRELYSEPWEFRELFDAIDSPSLKMCFDTGHAHMCRNTEEFLRELSDRIAYVHLTDNMGVDDDHLGYMRGTVPWETVFDLLAENAYDEVLCVEFEVRGDDDPFYNCQRELLRRFGRSD